MAYEKQNFVDGNPLYADQLNHIEQGIVDAEGQIPKKTSDLVNDSGYITDYSESDPTVPSWAKQSEKPGYTAAEVGADPSGTAVAEVADHNTSEISHTDIRLDLQALATKLNNFLDSDDATLDELSELITAIRANAGTISQLTSGKVNVADIINNLTTNVVNKPLSAAQGVALKTLIDALNTSLTNYQPKGDYALKSEIPSVPVQSVNGKTGAVKLSASDVGALPSTTTIPSKTSQLTNDSGFVDNTELDGAVADALAQAKLSGDFDGQRGTGILNTTTGIQSYTTTVNGIKPTYRILLTTLKTQSLVDNVYVGDTVRYSAFLYPVIYVDDSYAYMGTRVTIQGTAGTSVTVKSVNESTEPGGSNVVTFSDGKTLTVKNGSDYVLTDADKAEIAGLVDAAPDYDVNVKSVAHRGYSIDAPENTIPAYIMARQKGFKYAECDVSFTSDGVPVLLHDDTIDRTSNGTGNIAEMTYAEAMQYDFGSWKSTEYTGTKIATFEEFLKLCRNVGLHPYIELKNVSNATEARIQGLVDTVKKYGMSGNVSWISFSLTLLTYIKNYDSSARLGYLCELNDNSCVTSAMNLRTDNNEVFISMSVSSTGNINGCIDAGIPVEIWTIDTEQQVLGLNPYITGITSNVLIAGKILYDSSMVYTAPEIPDTSIAGQWASNGSANISEEIISGRPQSYPPYSSGDSSRAAYQGTALTVSPGDVISVAFEGNKYPFKWGIRSLTQTNLTNYINNANMGNLADSGWLTGDFTIPSNTVCIWIAFGRNDTANASFTVSDLGNVIVSKK